MSQLLAENWYLLVLGLVIGLIVAWFLFRTTRRTTVTGAQAGDVLDEGATRAQRNAALVDAPPAAAPISRPTGFGDAHAGGAATAEDGDDLTRLKGVGPKLATILRQQGITQFAQIAAWSDDDISEIDGTLGQFQGRITRDDWRGQARLLCDGDADGFKTRYGSGGKSVGT